jgi:signal transduction histidine kinase
VGSVTIKIDNPDLESVANYGCKQIKNPQEDSYIRISISDTGMGLSKNELDGIFEPYTQLDKTNKKTVLRSIVLGTALTIVRRMGGNITISSEVMRGTEFVVVLPSSKEE